MQFSGAATAGAPSPAFSLYLDAVRLIAALWVLLAHVRSLLPNGETITWLPESGHDAVTVFFVLSGYLIAHAAHAKRAQGLEGYLLDRSARIFSVALPLLLLSYGVGAVLGEHLGRNAYLYDRMWVYLPLFAANLHQVWMLREVPPLNIPYWSLSFEVWYYLLFGALMFLRGPLRWATAVVWALIAGIKLWLLAPLWFAGVALYRSRAGSNWSRTTSWLLLAGSALAYVLLEATNSDARLAEAGQGCWEQVSTLPLGEARRFIADYAIATLVVLHLAAARRLAPDLSTAAGIIRAGAGMSFTLYLLHAPLLALLASIKGIDWTMPVARMGAIAVVLAATALVAQVTEQQRGRWRRALECGWRWLRR